MKRRLGPAGVLAGAGAVAAAAAAAAAHRVSPRPAVALLKVLFDLGRVKLPAELASVASGVQVDRDLGFAVPGFPSASVDVYRPAGASAAPLPIVLWIHGGAFFAGSKAAVGPYAALLASRGHVVASLEYSLTPGAVYPTPVAQANAALGFLVGSASLFGLDPLRVFVGGDSAGAHISASLATLLSNPDYAGLVGITPAVPALRGAVLFCGLYDLTASRFRDSAMARVMLWAYTAKRDWSSFARIAELSPAHFATAAFPAAYITVGDADPLEPQALALETTLQGQGVPVTARYWPGAGLKHEFQYDLRKPESVSVFDDVVAFLSTA